MAADSTTAGIGLGLRPMQGVEATEPTDSTRYDDRPTAWRVNYRYQVSLEPRPGQWHGTVELIADTIVATERLDASRPGLAEWITHDSPGALEPTDDRPTGEPKQHVPRHILMGVGRPMP